MPLQGPPPHPTNPVFILYNDWRRQRRAAVPFPPGDLTFSIARSRRLLTEPLPLLLDAYDRFGPVFTLRLLAGKVVWMIGPEANHYILVKNAKNFQWRESHFRELIWLLGDGLLTIDGEFHRRSRQIMLPAFHREQIEASVGIIVEEGEKALESLVPGQRLDFFRWARGVALRVAMRAVFGFNPEGEVERELDVARLFVEALSFYSAGPIARLLRGPATPWARMQRARRKLDRLIYWEIAQRRKSGQRGLDVLSLLLDAKDEDGNGLNERQIRDEVMTLLFAGHDTTTATLAFMFYELGKNPSLLGPLIAEQEALLRAPSGLRAPTAREVNGEGLPELELVLEETLRMYPPAWIGPRRSVEPFEFAGQTVPGDAYVNYSSWVSHHLPHVFPEPERFLPERFTPERKAALPKGAYVPFGGGSRTCIGMRFGQVEIRTLATLLLQRFSLELENGYQLRIREAPTIGPKGLPVVVRERAAPTKPRTAQPALA